MAAVSNYNPNLLAEGPFAKLSTPLLGSISLYCGASCDFKAINRRCRDASKLRRSQEGRTNHVFNNLSRIISSRVARTLVISAEKMKFSFEHWQIFYKALNAGEPQRTDAMKVLDITKEQFKALACFSSQLTFNNLVNIGRAGVLLFGGRGSLRVDFEHVEGQQVDVRESENYQVVLQADKNILRLFNRKTETFEMEIPLELMKNNPDIRVRDYCVIPPVTEDDPILLIEGRMIKIKPRGPNFLGSVICESILTPALREELLKRKLWVKGEIVRVDNSAFSKNFVVLAVPLYKGSIVIAFYKRDFKRNQYHLPNVRLIHHDKSFIRDVMIHDDFCCIATEKDLYAYPLSTAAQPRRLNVKELRFCNDKDYNEISDSIFPVSRLRSLSAGLMWSWQKVATLEDSTLYPIKFVIWDPNNNVVVTKSSTRTGLANFRTIFQLFYNCLVTQYSGNFSVLQVLKNSIAKRSREVVLRGKSVHDPFAEAVKLTDGAMYALTKHGIVKWDFIEE